VAGGQVLGCAAVRGGCTSSFTPGHPELPSASPITCSRSCLAPPPPPAPAAVRGQAGQWQTGVGGTGDGGSLPSSLGSSPRQPAASPHHRAPPGAAPACPGGPLSPTPPPRIPASLAQSTTQLRSRQRDERVRLRPAARCCCQSNQPGDKTLL